MVFMNEQNDVTQLQGIVHVFDHEPGAVIEDDGGKIWVIDYRTQSSFQAFAECHVVACGEPYEPDPLSPHIGGWSDGKTVGHFRVSSIHLKT
jgi:hypothetical protein